MKVVQLRLSRRRYGQMQGESNKEVVYYSTLSPVGNCFCRDRVITAVKYAFNDCCIVFSRVDLFGSTVFSCPDSGNTVGACREMLIQAFQRMEERYQMSCLQRMDSIVIR